MPDNTYIDNSVIGFDPQDNLKLQVDTYNRLSPILNIQDKPMFTGNEPSLLHDNFQNQELPTAKSQLKGLSIADALDSTDSNVRNMGRQAMEEDMQKNVPGYSVVGKTVETPYEQGSKFINKKFGFSALRDNEDFYYKDRMENTTWVGRNLIRNPLTFIGRVAGETITKLGEGLGYMGSMITSIGSSNYFEKVADNSFSKWFEKQEDWLKNDLIPVYKQAGFDEKGFFSKLGDWSFWNDSVADAAAFMTSFAAQTFLTGGIGEASGLGKIGSLSINTASKLGKIGKGIDLGVKFLTGADDVTGIGNWAFNTASESFFESAGVFKETKQDLVDARKAGKNNYTDDDINRIASKRAAYDFKGNLMALTFSNAFENKFLFQPLRRYVRGIGETSIGNTKVRLGEPTVSPETSYAAEIIKPTYSSKVGKFLDYKNPQGRLRFYGTRALEASVIEGLYEENIQLAMERLSRYGNYEGKNFGQALSATGQQLKKQTSAAFRGKDEEALESIGLGALIGIVGTAGIAKMFGGERFLQGERKTEAARAVVAVDKYNSLRKEWLSVGNIYKDERGPDGEFVIDEDKVKAKAEGLSAALKKLVLPDDIINPVSRKLIQDDVLSDFVHAARMAGLDETILNRVDTLRNKSPKEIETLGFNPAETNSTPEQLSKDIRDLIDIHKESFKSTVKRPADVNAKEYSENEQERRYFLYKTKSLAWAAKNAFNTVDSAIMDETATHPFDVNNDPVVQEHNSVTLQLEKLNQFNNVQDKPDFYSEFVSQKKDELSKKLKETKNALKDKIENGELEENNNLLFSPKAHQQDLVNQIQHATSKNAFDQWNYTANKLSSLNNGYNNYQDWKKYQESISKNDEKADENIPEETHTTEEPAPTFKVGDNFYATYEDLENARKQGEISDEQFNQAVDEYNKTAFPNDVISNTPSPDVDVEPEEEKLDVVTQMEDDVVNGLIPGDDVDEEDGDKPLLWRFPGFTSKQDTTDVPGTKKKEEQLSTDRYSLMRGDFIKEFINSNDFGNNYKLFIVKDEFPQVYREQAGFVQQNDKGEWSFVTPEEATEVIVLQNNDGTPAKVGDFALKNDYKEFANDVIVFSIDQNVFFDPEYYDTRVDIKSRRNKITFEEADEENKALRKDIDDAREKIKNKEADRIEIKMMHYTSGIHPKTTWAPVQERFGDFSFEVVLPTVKGGTTSEQFAGKYPPGTIVAKIKGEDFPITTSKLSSNSEILAKIEKFLDFEYPTKEAAKNVRDNMLSILVGTNNKQFFRIDVKGDKFVINFARAREEDLVNNEERDIIRKNGIISNSTIGDAKLNVSVEAMRTGYKDFTSPEEDGELLTKEDYLAFIKAKLVTNLKKVTDGKGALYMKPVNPYFSFVVQTSAEAVDKVQKENYNKLKNRMLALANSGNYDLAKITAGLDSEFSKGNISEDQYNKLKEFSESEIPTGGISEVDPLQNAKDMLSAGTITSAAYDLMAKVIEKNKAEKEAQKQAEKVQAVEAKPEVVKAEIAPVVIVKEVKSIADKYKNKPKQDIAKVMAGKSSGSVEYKIEDKYMYVPEKNIFIHISNGKKIADSRLPEIIAKMAAQFPYKETATGNTGFNKLEVGNFVIYAPPTRIANAEITVGDNTIVNTSAMIATQLTKEEEAKAEEFLKRWCK